MKCLDIFAGIGGFHLGMERAGHKVVGAIENDKYKRTIYARHFPDTPILSDIKDITISQLPDAEIYTAGCPCPAFSNAGHKGGFEDSRGKIFFEVFRLAQEKRPSYIIIENVPGLLSNNGGNDFARILAKMDEIRYDAEWQCINTKHFLPQNRERVFIIGHAREKPTKQIFPIGDIFAESPETFKTTRKKRKRVQMPYSRTIDKHYHKGAGSRTMIVTKELVSGGQAARIYDDTCAVSLKSTAGGGGGKTGLYAVPVLTPDYTHKSQNGRRIKKDGEPASTVVAKAPNGIYDGNHIRRLTPTECARLQGFPDDWCDILSDTKQYNCYGDAVSVPVVAYLARHIGL